MDDFLMGLLQNLASAAIGGGIVVVARRYIEHLRHRAYSTFWELPGGKTVIIRSIASKRSDPDNPDRKVWMSDLLSTMAVEALWKFLGERGLEYSLVGEPEMAAPLKPV
jgi:hypothetical protein